ncbi:hypothetical protein C4C99_RS07550 [Vibrio parahaemolyticus]|uniref:hypothetical protein n=1 Tax=Vibrio harveyi group TaxID=717610 RepID=UPI000D530808|nr:MULTISPECIES: hypothetical protein [Vibrio harveyi group]AWG77813.1 hypothetical protein C9I78_02835 [Vibrio parahaemolyticus]AWJ77441.1 hypothetical protein C7Y67_02955 [Vibrio parahaemolyticus]EGQ8130898.1 hypothetical protein [Vibrio parahaemolyticus]EGQ8279285.1 hypothetical protein [Vibrio parahaemolyticus]EGQ8717690.1 hypothetical protein [Vibrio parahaemolyticus]
MTIVKSSYYLKHHPFLAIQEDAIVEFRSKCLSYAAIDNAMKLFECFCDITQQKVTFLTLQHPHFVDLTFGFLGALFSSDFCEHGDDTRWNLALAFFAGAVRVNTHFGHDGTPSTLREIREKCIQEWESVRPDVCMVRVLYWNGFKVVSRKGMTSHLALQRVHEAYSPKFAHDIYKHLARHFRSQAKLNLTLHNKFFYFIADHSDVYSEADFNSPQKIEIIFKDFLKKVFFEAHAKNHNLQSLSKAWNSWCNSIEAPLIKSGAWVMPISNQLPRVRLPSIKGSQTRIKKSSEGIEVKQKLITDIPLHITDQQAIELLFHQINNDIDLVVNWAKYNADDLWERHLLMKERAKRGSVIKGVEKGVSSEKLLDDISKTFEVEGFSDRFGKKFETRYTSKELLKELGLPSKSNDFASYKFLLINEHPAITTEFINSVELYDTKGNLSGFIKLDDATYLVGYKDRRGKALAEQKIKLNAESTRLINQVIALTIPLRERLKVDNDDNWRKLFLCCGGKFRTPLPTTYVAFNETQRKKRDKFYLTTFKELSRFTDKKDEDLHRFLQRVSLSTLRASCGVRVYLETLSVEEMAKALGHVRYDSTLLEHYLPEPILAFFQSRWIRIFQKSIICEAMKDSVYLLEATKFKNMDELHEFLENHALKNIPTSVTDSEIDNISPKTEKSQVYFAVDKGILTALLSLEGAVKSVPDKSKLNGKAIYWSNVSEMIVKEIERGKDRNLKFQLSQAQKKVNPKYMEDLIYATAN